MAKEGELSKADATEHTEETPLKEILTPQAAGASEITVKVVKAEVVQYSYEWKGKKVDTKKFVCILLSKSAPEYCLGTAKLQNKNEKELKELVKKFADNTFWKLSRIKLLDEKPQWINTSCRIVIDLRQSMSSPVLQSPGMPNLPEPPQTIANILSLKQRQRFDLMAIPVEILSQRRTSAGSPVADVRLMDGSKKCTNADESMASMPLTLFFSTEAEFTTFEGHVAKTPLLFWCLQGSREGQNVEVHTVKGLSKWEPAAGTKCEEMKQNIPSICNAETITSVAELRTFMPEEATDYTTCAATLTVCRLLSNDNTNTLLGDATEHLYQVNHVYVQPPHANDSIHTNDGKRLWTQSSCWDTTKSVTLGFRSKAMLALANLQPHEEKKYEELVKAGEIQYPILSSLRVRVHKKSLTSSSAANQSTDADTFVVVVEAEPQDIQESPNNSVADIHAIIASMPHASDRIAVSPLCDLHSSPFYNIEAGDCNVDKALVLLQSTRRSFGKLLAGGYRVITDDVTDATDKSSKEKFGVVAYCSIEASPSFMFPPPPQGSTASTAIAVLTKVLSPQKSEHKADLYVQQMQVVPPGDVKDVVEMFQRMQQHKPSNETPKEAATAVTPPWEQRKCRKICRYPTFGD